MKNILIFLFLFGTVKLFPQQINQPTLNNSASYNINSDKLMRCHKMQKNGIVMICVGGVGVIGGVVLFVSGLNDNIKQTNQSSNNTSSANDLPRMYAGSTLSIIGLLAVSAGTSLYMVGKKREKKWSNNVSIMVTPSSFRIAYKF